MAWAVRQQHKLTKSRIKSFVLDDSIKTRRGKKMEGVSSHFDHVTGHVIEVYFKEVKQHHGFLKEQTATFASHTASIYLCAIRYLMLAYKKPEGQDTRIGDVRSRIHDQRDSLSFATRL